MAKTPAQTSLALAKIELEETALELKLKLKGRPAIDLLDYRRAHQALNDQTVEIELLVQSMIARFIETDKGFQMWRKAHPLAS